MSIRNYHSGRETSRSPSHISESEVKALRQNYDFPLNCFRKLIRTTKCLITELAATDSLFDYKPPEESTLVLDIASESSKQWNNATTNASSRGKNFTPHTTTTPAFWSENDGPGDRRIFGPARPDPELSHQSPPGLAQTWNGDWSGRSAQQRFRLSPPEATWRRLVTQRLME